MNGRILKSIGMKILRSCRKGGQLLWRLESDSPIAISWIFQKDNIPWKFHYLLNEIRSLSSLFQVVFKHINRPDHFLEDSLDQHGEDRNVPFVGS